MISPEEINNELLRATTKHPDWPNDPYHALTIIAEEFGKLSQCVLQLCYEQGKTTIEKTRAEAVQLAVTALRFAASFDKYDFRPSAQHLQPVAYTLATAVASNNPAAIIPEEAKTQQQAPIAQETLFPEQEATKKKRNLDRSNQIRRVFRHWRATMNKTTAKLTDDRINLIARALFKWQYTEQQLIAAINGCAMTPHNMGLNDRGTPFNDLGVILRDAEHIERFAETAERPPLVPITNNKGSFYEQQATRAEEQFAEIFSTPTTTDNQRTRPGTLAITQAIDPEDESAARHHGSDE